MRKKQLHFIYLMFCTSVLFSSCIVVNFTGRDYDNTCEVHHIKMKKTLVGTSFGLSAYGPDPRFPNAKQTQNVGCVVEPWPIERLAIIYHCTACDSTMAYDDKLN